MDLSLATDTFSSAYLHQHHLQQQRQQQQQLLHYQHQQPGQHQQHHYSYHIAQHPQTLSLAPPSGKGFFDLECLEQKGSASGSLGLGHLGGASSYQPEIGLSSYAFGPPDPSSATTPSSHHLIPSSNSGQLWSRNPFSAHSQVVASQSLHHNAAQAATATPFDLHSGTFTGGSHHALQGWPVTEPRRLQLSHHVGDNCLPPGVEPSLTAGGNNLFSHAHTQPQEHAQVYPFASHSLLDLQSSRPLQYQAQSGLPVRSGKPPQKPLAKRKNTKDTEKQNPAGKKMKKVAGGTSSLMPEKGPGWCSVCERNCVTAVALGQHLEGKSHKKKVERQKLGAEFAPPKQSVVEDGGVSNMLEQVWMQVCLMSKPSRTGNPRKKQKVEEAGKDLHPANATLLTEGDFTIRKRKPKAGQDMQPTAAEPNAVGESPPVKMKKVLEKIYCELCDVECNSQVVLEIHLKGRKHAARLKSLQETTVASNPDEASLVIQ